MLSSEDQDMPVNDNGQERDGSEATSPRKRMELQPREMMAQTQRDLELSPKSRSISGVYHKIWRQAMQMIIQKTISQKKMSKRRF